MTMTEQFDGMNPPQGGSAVCPCNNAQPIVGTAVFPEQKSSVEISKNSKGDIQYSIKVYDSNPAVALTLALDLKKNIEEKLA